MTILTSATEALKAIPSFHGINEYTLERAARAVAVAVLEHARDNVSEDMATAYRLATWNIQGGYRGPSPWEACIDALLAELDGTESEVGK